MSIRSYCYVLNGVLDDDVAILRGLITQEKILAKAAVLKRVDGKNKLEIVVDAEGTMRFLVNLFKKRTGTALNYVEEQL